jgi:hypothetical protein
MPPRVDCTFYVILCSVAFSFPSFFTKSAFCILIFPNKRTTVQKRLKLNLAVLELRKLHCMLNNGKVNWHHKWSNPVFSQDAGEG